MTTDTVCGRFAGEPKHRQWLDALLLTLGSCKSRQRNCHEEEGGEAKGMTGSKLLRRPLAGSVLRNEAYCLAWRDFLHRRLMTNTAFPALGVGWSVRLVRDRGGLARWVFGAISTCIGNHDSGSLFFQ
jgi:hypothetical protein